MYKSLRYLKVFPDRSGAVAGTCTPERRANMAPIRQSLPDSGGGFQAQVLQNKSSLIVRARWQALALQFRGQPGLVCAPGEGG